MNLTPSSPPLRVLVADDDPAIRTLLQYTLEKAGFTTVPAGDGREALELAGEETDVALLDVRMPRMDGLQCLQELRLRQPDLQVIMITAHSDVRDAVEAIRRGAFDYITKPFDPEELITTVRQAARTGALARENRNLRQAIGASAPALPFIGVSPAVREVLERARRLAGLDSNLLITGESGTGKGLLARLIHRASPRAAGPFVTVNCTTLPRELIESELFGHERGAFTGAAERRPGRIEMAAGGTLFLDEIGDLPLDAQPKLLAFLQERTFQRVGGNRELRVDVRVVAATNQDLQQKVRERQFREDLYFRLNVLALHVAPLRERREDIAPLTDFLLGQIARRRNDPPLAIAAPARAALLAHPWTGNVRELENVLERATVFCAAAALGVSDLGLDSSMPAPAAGAHSGQERPTLAGLTLAEIERLAIEQTLAACGGNKARASRELGISEKTIYNKIQRFRARRA